MTTDHIPYDEAERRHMNGNGASLWRNPTEPKPLPDGLRPVQPFDPALLPDSVRPWALDISETMQSPLDYVGTSLFTGLGAAIGRRCGIHPKQRADWLVLPNLWGLIIGEPGWKKSPTVSAVLKPFNYIEAQSREQNEAERHDYEAQCEAHKLRKAETEKRARKALSEGKDPTAFKSDPPPERPKRKRFVVNDATYEKLHEILSDNPNGVLLNRDEIVSLFRYLDQDSNATARAFVLQAWSGADSYDTARIGRGDTFAEATCLSVFGTTQPNVITEYYRGAVRSGIGNDGLLQRFSLMSWPDLKDKFRYVDQWPNRDAKEEAWGLFRRLVDLTPEAIGAEISEYEPVPFLRFDDRAQPLFEQWYVNLQNRIRESDDFPALKNHLSKFDKLVPALALICHLADGGTGPVSGVAFQRAEALADYFESHARRTYESGRNAAADTAKLILEKVRKGHLPHEFTTREIYQKNWTRLNDREQVEAALTMLSDYDWIAGTRQHTGGRPSILWRVNPLAFRDPNARQRFRVAAGSAAVQATDNLIT